MTRNGYWWRIDKPGEKEDTRVCASKIRRRHRSSAFLGKYSCEFFEENRDEKVEWRGEKKGKKCLNEKSVSSILKKYARLMASDFLSEDYSRRWKLR